MNQRLSTWLLFGAFLLWPLTACGQETNLSMARRTTGASVSVRELSIPESASNAYKEGIDRLAKNDPAASLVHLQRAVSEFPDFYEAYYAIGLAQLKLGHEEEAERAFRNSIDASGGDYAEPHFGLSVLLCNQRKFIEALPIIHKALELAQSFGPGQFILAWALYGLNRLDEAEENAHEALAQDPSFAPAHILLANIYNRRSDYFAALGELDAYLRLMPHGALSDQVRGVEKFLKRKLASSIVIVEAARTTP